MTRPKLSEETGRLASPKKRIWLVGIAAWSFGFIDRAIASFADGHLAVDEAIQLLAIALFFASWFSLKPKVTLRHEAGIDLQ